MSSAPLPHILSNLLAAVGIAVVGVSFAADRIGWGGDRGFGVHELGLVAAGGLILLVGLLSSPARRKWLGGVVDRAVPGTPALCLGIAFWFGVVTGLVELGHMTARVHLWNRFGGHIGHFAWLVPACYAAFFTTLGVLCALPFGRLRRLVNVPVVVFLFASLSIWSQLLVYRNIDSAAALLLAWGAAWTVARAAARRPRAVEWLVTKTAVPLALILTIWVGTLALRPVLSEFYATSQLPESRAGDPNVLLIVLDTIRADNLSLYGYERETSPVLDQLEPESVVFDWALTTSSWTLPSHGSMFTGRYPHELTKGFMWKMDDAYPTLAEALTARGYATAGFVGNLGVCSRTHGLNRGFTHYEDHYLNASMVGLATSLGRHLANREWQQEIVHDSRNDAETLTRAFADWVEARGDRPFFAFLNLFDAHALYNPPAQFQFAPRGDSLEKWDTRVQHWSDQQMTEFVDGYDGCIASVDHHLETVFDALRRTGEFDNTLLIITADHGEQFGEKGLIGHANSLYRPCLRAPLLVRFPGRIPAGRRVSDTVTLRDLAATIVDYTGIDAEFPGHSLRRFWEPGSATPADASPILSRVGRGVRRPPWEPVALGTMHSIVEAGMHYILNGDGSEELYDLRDDPRIEHDLSQTAPGAAITARLRHRLVELVGDHLENDHVRVQ